MPRPRATAVVVTVFVVFAGCTTFGAGPDTPTPSPTANWPADLPPGVTTTRVAEPLELVRAHAIALAGRSFTYRATVSVSTADDIPLGTITTIRRVDGDGRFSHQMRVEGFIPSALTDVRTVDAYSDGSRTVIRYRATDENRTLIAPVDEAAVRANDVVRDGTVYSVLATTDPVVVGAIRRGGTTYLHLRGENGTVHLGLIRATNTSFEALVAPSGIVHRYAMTADAADTTGGEWEGQLVQTVVYEDVGMTTVERPDWVTEALPNATEVPAGP